MNVIKHGKYYNKSMVITCKHCGCMFKYSQLDVNTYTFANRYVDCPECGYENTISKQEEE